MKRSKIFLVATTALLAIAGLAAAKAHRGVPVTVYYGTLYDPSTNKVTVGHCQKDPFMTSYTASGIGARGYYRPTGTPAGGYFLYTNSTCTVPAYFNVD